MRMMSLMLTTRDNPHNPFDEPDEWYSFDERHGYCTSGLNARVIVTSDELSEVDQQLDFNRAVQDIMRANNFALYVLVEREIDI